MDAFGWPELVALLTSIGFGIVSAIVPIVNAEAYVIASQMSAVIGPIPIAIGIAIGQTIGKLLLFFGVREGKELPSQYWRYFKTWIALGIPAFFAFVAVFYLMVAKPA